MPSREHEDPKRAVGYLLKRFREERGLSLRQLSRDVSLDSAYLSRIERGLVPASDAALRALCVYFHAPEFYVAAGKFLPADLRPLFLKDRLRDYLLRYQQMMSDFAREEKARARPDQAETLPAEDPYRAYAEIAPRPLPEVYSDSDYDWQGGYEALGIPHVWINIFPPLRSKVISEYLKLRDHEGRQSCAAPQAGEAITQEYLTASLAVAYSEGYIEGLLQAYGIFKETFEKYSLFWLLTAFLSPGECKLLSDVYEMLKSIGFSREAQAAVRAFLETYLEFFKSQSEAEDQDVADKNEKKGQADTT